MAGRARLFYDGPTAVTFPDTVTITEGEGDDAGQVVVAVHPNPPVAQPGTVVEMDERAAALYVQRDDFRRDRGAGAAPPSAYDGLPTIAAIRDAAAARGIDVADLGVPAKATRAQLVAALVAYDVEHPLPPDLADAYTRGETTAPSVPAPADPAGTEPEQETS